MLENLIFIRVLAPRELPLRPTTQLGYVTIRISRCMWRPHDDDDNKRSRGTLTSSTSTRLSLPIYRHRKQILSAVETYKVVVIVGETGSGKSTQIPQYLYENGWTQHGFRILVTQPRRIAAVSLATRVAAENRSASVGYTVRGSHKEATDIQFVTDGTVVQRLLPDDPFLSRYSIVFMDEIHERSIHTDALAALLRKIRNMRPHLRIVCGSATVNATAWLRFFCPDNSNDSRDGTILSVDGRLHPVHIYHSQQPVQNYVTAMVETVQQIIITAPQEQQSGDILGFLPTTLDIDRVIRLCHQVFQDDDDVQLDFLALHGNLPLSVQHKVLLGSSSRRRRVIFSTNMAETSVTVPGIRYIVDSGLVRLPYFCDGLERLITGPCSQASAKQRAGRAGRTAEGTCYRLYTEQTYQEIMTPQTPPEILRTNLSSFLLTLKALGVDNVLAFDLLDVPSVDSLSYGLELLHALGAIDDRTHLTTAGLQMSTFPTEPVVARMLLESLTVGCAWEVLAVAAALQVRDLRRPPPIGAQKKLDYDNAVATLADASGDHLTYVNVLAAYEDTGMGAQECRENFLNLHALQRCVEIRNQLAKFLRQFGKVRSMATDDSTIRSRAIRRCVTAGFFGHTARLGNDGRYYTLRYPQVPVTPAPSSVLSPSSLSSSAAPAAYIVYGETADGRRGGLEIHHVSAVEARWLHELAPSGYFGGVVSQPGR